MNIIFDIGKVLIDFDWEKFVGGMFDEKTAAAVTEAMWENPDWSELDRGALEDEQVLELFISKKPGYEREIRFAFAKLGECPHMKPTTIPMIKKLKADGHKVYYLSNYFRYLMHTAPWALEFVEYMDGGVFSCNEKKIKPDPAVYQILCERYSLNKEDCVFIDDSMVNIKAAEEFGIRAIHYHGQTPEQLYGEIFI